MAQSEISPKKPRILVVENHPDTLKYLVLYLEAHGYATVQARTLEEALLKSSTEPCDVLISDIGLPDGTGWELMRRLSLEGTAPRFAVAMSGYGAYSDEKKSRSAGYRSHLIKPFEPAKLQALLDDAAKDIT